MYAVNVYMRYIFHRHFVFTNFLDTVISLGNQNILDIHFSVCGQLI